MKRRLFLTGIVLAVTAVVATAVMFLASFTAPAAAQTEQPVNEALRTVQVSGRGQVMAEPDRAIVRFGVQTEADSAQDALAENSEQMTAVISATLEAGVAEADIQTSGFQLQPQYDAGPDGTNPELTGYRASNIVQVTVRDLEQIGELLDTVVSAGSNTIEGIQFEVSDQADMQAAAREAAIEDARQRAEQLAELTGAELGPVQTIMETAGFGPAPLATTFNESFAASVPVQPGTQAIETIVQVTWLLQ
jgi:uncharacterized protein